MHKSVGYLYKVFTTKFILKEDIEHIMKCDYKIFTCLKEATKYMEYLRSQNKKNIGMETIEIDKRTFQL